MNYQDNKKKRTGENAVKKYKSGVKITGALLAAALLCTACGQAEDTTQELPPPTPTLAATDTPEISVTPKPTLEINPTVSPAEKETTEAAQWSKHAFLLENDDVFFVRMPQEWRGFVDLENPVATVYCPALKGLSNGYEGYYDLTVKEAVCLYEGDKLSDEGESFTFYNGEIGKKYIRKGDAAVPHPVLSGSEIREEIIFSPDGQYVFTTNALSSGQYKEYQKQSEQLYKTMMFQSGRIGEKQEEALQVRDNVHIYVCGNIPVEADVPEGVLFERKSGETGNTSLVFYLDESKKYYVELLQEVDGIRCDLFYEAYGKMVTEEDYKEPAIYHEKTSGGVTSYVYQFLYGEELYAEFCVPAGDETMLQTALDIVKSMELLPVSAKAAQNATPAPTLALREDTALPLLTQGGEAGVRDYYILDSASDIWFSAQVPEHWYCTVNRCNQYENTLHFDCMDTERGGAQNTNYFCLDIEPDEVWQRDVVYELSCYEVTGNDMTAERYEQNKEWISAFQDSIQYQTDAKQFGNISGATLAESARVRLHVANEYLNVELMIPEGIRYEIDTQQEQGYRLRMFLDEGKENYIEIGEGFAWEEMIDSRNYLMELTDAGRVAYYEEKTQDGMQKRLYTFVNMPVTIDVVVKKECTDLYTLAQEIVKSILFEGEFEKEKSEAGREAYFIDDTTIFCATFPENWKCEALNAASGRELRGYCQDSKRYGFSAYNVFEFTLKSAELSEREYEGFVSAPFEYADGKTAVYYEAEGLEHPQKEYFPDWGIEEYQLHVSELWMPGEEYVLCFHEIEEQYLSEGRYEKNKELIQAFMESILYQSDGRIGSMSECGLAERERIRLHLDYCFSEEASFVGAITVPEGIRFEVFTDEKVLRLYLDEEKQNYVDVYPDTEQRKKEELLAAPGYLFDAVNYTEPVYYLETEAFGRWNCRYAFSTGPVVAEISVAENQTELYALAQELVQSIILDSTVFDR